MQGGDLSNEISPRIIVVWDGLLGFLPVDKRRRENLLIKAKQWDRAVRLWDLNDLAARRVNDMAFRMHQTIDVVTWRSDEFAESLTEYLEEEDVFVSRVFASSPERLSRSLAFKPHLAAIYDGNPSHQFTYGGKGVIVDPTNPITLGLFFGTVTNRR